MLGIKFSTNLEEMIELSYDKVLVDIQNMVTNWSKRNLTPIGKITVIKTLLISKMNHLFVSLPTPKNHYTEKINKILFRFLWNDKPDKISRDVVVQSYWDGGLKMLNIKHHINALNHLD